MFFYELASALKVEMETIPYTASMKILAPFTALLSLLLAVGCTSVPDTYVRDAEMPSHCGYKTEATEQPGFALEVYYRSYAFLPIPDKAVKEAKECFQRAAARVAKEAGKKMKPLLNGDINASPSRNDFDGYYAVYVTGRVRFID